MPAAVLLAALTAAFGPIDDNFDAGRLTDAWKLSLSGRACYARFEPRDGGQCLHLYGDRAQAAISTRQPLPNIAYTLDYDFFQPGKEAHGYQAVVRHERPEGYSYWWLEYGPGRFFLYTLAGGVWYNRWRAAGLVADAWYHIRVRNTPSSVQIDIYDATGRRLLRRSPALPHDDGSPGPLTFAAVGTDRGPWGMKIDNVCLRMTPIAERDDYLYRKATVEAVEKATRQPVVAAMWPAADDRAADLGASLAAVRAVDPADWAAYTKALSALDEKLRAFAEQYHQRVIARLNKRRGDWVVVDLWQYFDAEAAAQGIQVPAGAPVVVVRDVPFAAIPFGRNCIWQDEGSRSRKTIRLAVSAKRIALLIGPKYNADLYARDDSLIDVLQVELRYSDGRRERVVPLPAGWKPLGPNGVGRPPYPNARADAFFVVPGHAARIDELVLCDDGTQAGWALFALSYQPGLPDELPLMQAGPQIVPSVARQPATSSRRDGVLIVENPSLRLGLSTKRGELTRLESPYLAPALPAGRSSPYFAVQLSDRLVYSDAFEVTGVHVADLPDGVSVTLRLRGPSNLRSLEVRVTIAVGDGGETTWQARLTNRGSEPLQVRLIFPLLDGLNLGDSPGWYFPQRAGAVSNLPIEGLSSYGGMAWLQLLAAWGQRGGLYLRCDDTTGLYKVFALRCAPAADVSPRRVADIPKPAHPLDPWRAPAGVHMSVQYLPRVLTPGASWSLPPATIAVYPGNWRQALADYRRWLQTWWKPLRPCPARYRYGFYALVGGPPRDDQRGAEFGSYDWWHLGGIWSIDYPDQLKPQIAEWQKQARRAAAWGQAIGLYIEGMVMEKRRRIAREHGAEWAMMDDTGRYYAYYSQPSNPVWNMCPAVRGWQQWDAWAYAQLARRVSLCAMYVDSLGSRWAEVCYNPAHNHPTPGIWPRGCAELFETIRQAVMKVSPDIAIHSEEPGCDYMAVHEDGSWSHTLWTRLSGDPEYNPAGLNYFRFVLPEFKMYEIPSYRHALWRCKLAFFNGEGLWTNAPDQLRRELFIRWMPTLREHAETFLSTDVEPALPLVRPPLYMNAFRRGPKTIYTVYNAGLRTLRARVLVPLPADGHVFDLLALREMPFEPRGQRAVLTLELDPHQVKCFVVCPRLLRAGIRDGQLQVSVAPRAPSGQLVATAVDRRGVRVARRRLSGRSPSVNISDLFGDTDAERILVRLATDHDTADIACVDVP